MRPESVFPQGFIPEHALRQLDETFRVYQYVIKRPSRPVACAAHAQPIVHEALQRRAAYLASKADTLFELELYFVVLYEGWTLRPTIASRLGVSARMAIFTDYRKSCILRGTRDSDIRR